MGFFKHRMGLRKKSVMLLLWWMVLPSMVVASVNEEKPVVVFDFGGVIGKADRSKILAFLESTGCCDGDFQEALTCMRTYRKEMGSEKEFWKERAKSKGLVLPEDWDMRYDETVKGAIYNIPGTLELISRLQRAGYPIALLSNVTEEKAMILRELGYYDSFSPALLSYAIGTAKPHPEAFFILITTLNRSPQEIIFIDDKPQNIQAASDLQLHALLFSSATQLEADLLSLGLEF